MSAQGQHLDLVTIENLQEQDLAEADHIFRLAFGTFIGLPDPASFHQGADYVRTRWKADPAAAFAAKIQGKLASQGFLYSTTGDRIFCKQQPGGATDRASPTARLILRSTDHV